MKLPSELHQKTGQLQHGKRDCNPQDGAAAECAQDKQAAHPDVRHSLEKFALLASNAERARMMEVIRIRASDTSTSFQLRNQHAVTE